MTTNQHGYWIEAVRITSQVRRKSFSKGNLPPYRGISGRSGHPQANWCQQQEWEIFVSLHRYQGEEEE